MKFKTKRILQRMRRTQLRMLTLSISFSLTFSPTFLFAKDSDSKGNSNAGQIMQMGLQTITSGINTYLQEQQKTQATMNALNSMNQNKVVTPVVFPDSFPFMSECSVSKAEAIHIEGMCSGNLSSDANYAEAVDYMQRARTQKELYHNLTVEAGQQGSSRGIKCMGEQLDELKKNLDTQEAYLAGQIQQVKDEAAAFQKEAAERLNTMKDLQTELDGGKSSSGEGRESLQHKEFSSLFNSDACRQIYSSTTVNKVGQMEGLRGIQKSIETKGVDKARSLIRNKTSLKTQIQKDIAKLVATVKREDGLNDSALSSSTFKNAYSKKAAEINSKYTTKQKDLLADIAEDSALLPAPRIDATTKRGREKALSTSPQNKWKRSYMSSCLNGKAPGAEHDLSSKTLLSRLEADNISTSGSRVKNFKTELRRLFQSLEAGEISVDTFNSKVSSLSSSETGVIQIDLGISYAGEKSTYKWPVGKLIGTMVSDCKSSYSSSNLPNGKSMEKTISDVVNSVSNLEQSKDDMASELAQSLTDQMINCTDVPYSTGESTDDTGCDSKKLDTKSANFCVEDSMKCAQSMDTCHAYAKALVKQTEGQLRTEAQTYNDRITEYKTKQNAYLKQLSAKFIGYADKMKQTFPGVSYEMPELASIVDKVAKTKSVEGLEVALADPTDVTEALIKNLESFKAEMKNQHKAIAQSVTKYIGEMKSAFKTEEKYWENEINKCDNLRLAYEAQKQEAEAKNAEQQNANYQACMQFNAMANSLGANNRPGCDGNLDQLSGAAAEAAAADSLKTAWRSYCSGVEVLEDMDDEEWFEEAINYCDNHPKDKDCALTEAEYKTLAGDDKDDAQEAPESASTENWDKKDDGKQGAKESPKPEVDVAQVQKNIQDLETDKENVKKVRDEYEKKIPALEKANQDAKNAETEAQSKVDSAATDEEKETAQKALLTAKVASENAARDLKNMQTYVNKQATQIEDYVKQIAEENKKISGVKDPNAVTPWGEFKKLWDISINGNSSNTLNTCLSKCTEKGASDSCTSACKAMESSGGDVSDRALRSNKGFRKIKEKIENQTLREASNNFGQQYMTSCMGGYNGNGGKSAYGQMDLGDLTEAVKGIFGAQGTTK